MPNTVSEKVQRWALEAGAPVDYNLIHAEIEYLTSKRFDQYVPTIGPHPSFRSRLARWLSLLTDEADQKLLFRLVPHIFFLGREEYAALHRAAFNGPIHWWLIDQLGFRLDDPNLDSEVGDALASTWFCPITDSAGIADFYHANNIHGSEHRPGWRFLAHISGEQRILEYMRTSGLNRVVLIEDFVGSGTQMSEVAPLLTALAPNIPILITPHIICPDGMRIGEQLATAFTNVTFEPVLPVPAHAFIAPNPHPDEPALFRDIRELIRRVYPTVSGSATVDEHTIPYGPFGFARTGGLVVTFSNCPDNSLPVVHHRSATWDPLFPRSSRI